MNIIIALAVGFSSGALYALIGVGLTLMSVLTRVINFSLVAVGVFGAYLSIRTSPLIAGASLDVQTVITVVVAVLVAALISGILGWIEATWLSEATTTARSAVTVASLLMLISLSFILFGSQPQPLRPLLIGPAFLIGDVAVTKVGVAMLVAALVVGILTWIVVNRTPLGIRLRAVSDRQTAAELLGVNVKGLQVGVWMVVGGVMGLCASIIGNTAAADATSMITLVIPGTAAALVGAFKNIPLTIVGGLVVGALQGALTAFPSTTQLRDWIPILVIVLFLLWNQRKEVWDVAR
ncbi:branched-chain amino acid ABC transporter permease [Galbitalea soli]|uniref:Branched-chain amino acid ABC transporter permease n=1 Tax=Galbitalea soli TaxID=1268042 RepID=A0A7C9TQK4_9MICO|nr:branched-chain amino acid ABC transporter permease [Galbitalea soli]NEM91079.1 branched-chain amino acid ABC transporter permease [Galbitalea soli]NYJ29767.1 branched-chain amino acid transport system permease protein [Galbitalea soli]